MSTTSAQALSLHDAIASHDALWLCLYFSQLALDIFDHETFNTYDRGRPLAVVEQRIVHCANRDNLPPGLALATAQALYPDLLALERQPDRERDYLNQLAHWAYQFTPNVVITHRNSLLLEIGSCRRLYRGTRNLLKKIQCSLEQRDQYADLGLAHTAKAAWLLAECDCALALIDDRIDPDLLAHQLEQIPITVLAINEEAQQALDQMGLTALGALCDLPTAALGKRFGVVFVDYLRKVVGVIPDPQQFFTPTARFQHGLAFIDGIPQRQMLLFPMKRLLQALDDYLRARQLHCHTLQWKLFDAHGVQVEFSIELSRSQHRWQDLLELSRIKLDQIQLTAHVFSINLFCENFFEAIAMAQQLFPDENDKHEAAAALIDRLQARLGKEALQQVETQESHWPELAWRLQDKNAVPLNRRSSKSFATTNHREMNRPLWLLSQAQRLQQRNNQPCWPTPLILLRGPERIDNHWWQEQQNERDYYVAQNQRGAICWIFYERETQQWFLHGLFA